MKDRVSGSGGYNTRNGAKRYGVYDTASATTPSKYVFLKLEDNATEVGTPLNVANLLDGTTEKKFSLNNGTPNQALNKIGTITSINIAVNDWAQSGSVFVATKSVSGVTANSVPSYEGLIFGSTPTDTQRKNAQRDSAYIYQMETVSGAIKFYATKKPTVALTVGVRGV